MLQTFQKDFFWWEVWESSIKCIWYIVWIVFDISTQKCIWCTYQSKSNDKRAFFFEDIKDIWGWIIRLKNLREKTLFYDIIGKKVQNQSGVDLGYTNDVEFDSFYNLISFGMEKKYFLPFPNFVSQKIPQTAIMQYKKDIIIVQDTLFIKENKKWLEKLWKIFINIPEYEL